MKPLIIALAAFALLTANTAPALADDASSAASPSGELIIVKAEYGDIVSGAANDVTKKVAGMVKHNTLTVAASNNFGDPAEGVHKQLKVDYTLDGKPGSQTVPEGRTLKIPADAK